MNELVDVLGGGLPLLLFLLSIILYFQNRPETPPKNSSAKAPLSWNERMDLRHTYASMPLYRLVPLYCESGLKEEARNLIAHELKNRGWQERTLETGKTVLVEPYPASQEAQVSSGWNH